MEDGLAVIGSGIERVRGCVSFWVATPKRAEMFENKARALKIDYSRKIVSDVKTRWNPTFSMLKSAIPYKNVFASLKVQNYRMRFEVPSDDEWYLAELYVIS